MLSQFKNVGAKGDHIKWKKLEIKKKSKNLKMEKF